MSYDYFMQAHVHGEAQEIPTEKFLRIFEKYISQKDDNYIDLYFDELNSCTVYMDTGEPTNSGITINRPCADERLIRCLYAVMQLGNFVFYEPDGKHMIALSIETEQHLPEDMVETLGKPLVAEGWEAFLEAYTNNRE